jgi:peroxiredoxin
MQMQYIKILAITLIVFYLPLSSGALADSADNSLTKLKANPIAPDFTLQDVNGKRHTLSDYRGKVVVINFWASWCPPCVSEMPSLQILADKLSRHQIPVIGVGVGERRDSVRRFLKSMPIRFPLLLDINSEVMETWSAPSLPTTLVIDQKGRIVLLALGTRDWSDEQIFQQIISLK